MKISCVLPSDINKAAAREVSLVTDGLVTGWANLPPAMQRVVEWSGIILQDEGDRIEVEVKVVTHFILAKKTIPHEEKGSFRVEALPGKVPEFVAKKFRETVVELLRELEKSLQRESNTVHDMLNAQVTAIFS